MFSHRLPDENKMRLTADELGCSVVRFACLNAVTDLEHRHSSWSKGERVAKSWVECIARNLVGNDVENYLFN